MTAVRKNTIPAKFTNLINERKSPDMHHPLGLVFDWLKDKMSPDEFNSLMNDQDFINFIQNKENNTDRTLFNDSILHLLTSLDSSLIQHDNVMKIILLAVSAKEVAARNNHIPRTFRDFNQHEFAKIPMGTPKLSDNTFLQGVLEAKWKKIVELHAIETKNKLPQIQGPFPAKLDQTKKILSQFNSPKPADEDEMDSVLEHWPLYPSNTSTNLKPKQDPKNTSTNLKPKQDPENRGRDRDRFVRREARASSEDRSHRFTQNNMNEKGRGRSVPPQRDNDLPLPPTKWRANNNAQPPRQQPLPQPGPQARNNAAGGGGAPQQQPAVPAQPLTVKQKVQQLTKERTQTRDEWVNKNFANDKERKSRFNNLKQRWNGAYGPQIDSLIAEYEHTRLETRDSSVIEAFRNKCAEIQKNIYLGLKVLVEMEQPLLAKDSAEYKATSKLEKSFRNNIDKLEYLMNAAEQELVKETIILRGFRHGENFKLTNEKIAELESERKKQMDEHNRVQQAYAQADEDYEVQEYPNQQTKLNDAEEATQYIIRKHLGLAIPATMGPETRANLVISTGPASQAIEIKKNEQLKEPIISTFKVECTHKAPGLFKTKTEAIPVVTVYKESQTNANRTLETYINDAEIKNFDELGWVKMAIDQAAKMKSKNQPLYLSGNNVDKRFAEALIQFCSMHEGYPKVILDSSVSHKLGSRSDFKKYLEKHKNELFNDPELFPNGRPPLRDNVKKAAQEKMMDYVSIPRFGGRDH